MDSSHTTINKFNNLIPEPDPCIKRLHPDPVIKLHRCSFGTILSQKPQPLKSQKPLQATSGLTHQGSYILWAKSEIFMIPEDPLVSTTAF